MDTLDCGCGLVFRCAEFFYTTVIQEVHNRDRSPEVDDVQRLAAAATKHLELLKQKDKAEDSHLSQIIGYCFYSS